MVGVDRTINKVGPLVWNRRGGSEFKKFLHFWEGTSAFVEIIRTDLVPNSEK